MVALSTASSCSSSSYGGHISSDEDDFEANGPFVAWPAPALCKVLSPDVLVQPKPVASPAFSKCNSDEFNGALNNQNTTCMSGLA